MSWLKGVADIVGRVARFIAPRSEPERPLTEDDIRTDRYLRQHRASA